MEKHYQTLELNKIINKIKDRCQLSINHTKLDNCILSNDLDEINHNLNEVDEAVILLQRLQRFPLYFRSDIKRILGLINKSHVITIEELIEINKFFDTLKANQVFLDSINNLKINASYFQNNIEKLYYPKELNLEIKNIITPYGEIKDTASTELFNIRKSIRELEKNIQNKLQEYLAKHSSKLTETLISIRNDRYVIPVKNEHKNAIPGVIHDQSASGETFFIEPLVINELNNKLNYQYEAEKKEINSILKQISKKIDSYYNELIISFDIISHLDIVFSKAEYAISINAKKPRINNEGILELYNCRHPLLNVENVIPNNVLIGKLYQGIIITGPNTGGKTVLLKTVGLLSLMVKLGLLVPCDEESNLMIFDNVFADIGDEQSIDQNLSTFSSHMKNVINIINNVSNNSLVLLDELGSGTDPIEGASLAISIIEYFLEKKCLIIATSHYSELKTYAFNSEKIINASVEFNLKTLKPTYKLLIGVPGMSNALKISETLGLPHNIIDNASKYAYSKSDETNIALNKLIKQTHEFDRKLNDLNEKNKVLQNKINDVEKEKEELTIEKKKILLDAENKAKELIKKTSSQIDNLISELNSMKFREVKAHEIADIKFKVKELKESVDLEEVAELNDYTFEANQSVFVENYGAYGIIIKENRNNRYDVQIGNATVTVDKKFLVPKINQQQFTKPKQKNIVLSVKKNVPSTLDLRGVRYEEAKIKLEKFVDDAIYGSLNIINIIHGFGTGVIRNLVIDYLKTSPHVESFRYGGSGEGGQGVTIVTLKK